MGDLDYGWCCKGDSIALTHFLQIINLTLFQSTQKNIWWRSSEYL